MFESFRHKETEPEAQTQILSGQVSEHGILLENSVRREIGLSPDWELHQMDALLKILQDDGFLVGVQNTPHGGWVCLINPKDSTQSLVKEGGLWAPTALARAAVAAYRTWPRS